MSPQENNLQVRRATPAEVIDLRHAVLRSGLPRETAIFPNDDAPTSKHFVVEQNENVIGCATLHLNQWDDEPAWQLRGMAVAPAHQRTGVGSMLLQSIDEEISKTTPTLLWCNARSPAIPFYQRHGWQIASSEFQIPHAGPHMKMTRQVGPS